MGDDGKGGYPAGAAFDGGPVWPEGPSEYDESELDEGKRSVLQMSMLGSRGMVGLGWVGAGAQAVAGTGSKKLEEGAFVNSSKRAESPSSSVTVVLYCMG